MSAVEPPTAEQAAAALAWFRDHPAAVDCIGADSPEPYADDHAITLVRAAVAGALEVDRLRAELAETRRVGDAVAGVVDSLLTYDPAYAAQEKHANEIVAAWRSVRGDAPAPAEPPAARCRCGVQRGNEHLRNCRERCQDCGGDLDGPRRCACAEPPAVELPVTLSSVDDVAAVCLAHGLTVRSSGPGWTQWRDPDTKVVVHCEAWQSGVERVTVAGRDRADIYRPVARGTLVAAIKAARGGSR